MSDSNSPFSEAPRLPRRAFIGRVLAIGAAGLGGTTLLAACGDGGTEASGGAGGQVVDASTCEGYDALDEAALQTRASLNYADNSEREGQYCSNCRFKQAYEADNACLGCQLFAGPVSPGGWCQTWAATAA